ncbi:MAG: hypothetical protein PHN26_09725, partial [Eubacteriaceae bacterium]|nr:hypothetical protein [Eubacteriaceae bacterium]
VAVNAVVFGTPQAIPLEVNVIAPSVAIKDLKADGQTVETVPAGTKEVTGTLYIDSDVKDAAWFHESKNGDEITNPDSVAYLMLGGSLASSKISLNNPSVTGTLKNAIPFTITLDENRTDGGDGTITIPKEENVFETPLTITIPVTAPEKTAEMATPTADAVTTTQTTPQTTAEQVTEPTTTVDQNTAAQNVTESIKETPVLSLASGIVNTLSAKGLEITNANEYYAGQSVDSMTLKATGGVTFAQNLSADGFALQNGFSQLSIDSIKRDSDVQITLNLKKGNQIVNGIDDENKGWIAYDNGQITVKSNQLSGEATQDMTAEVPVATPNVVLKDVKADAKGIKTNGATAQNISSDTKVITGTIQLDNVPATYSCFKSKMGTLDMISSNSIILGGAFNKVTDAEFEINPNNKNEVKFSITIPAEMTASTGSITIPAQYNCFDQDMTVNFNIDTITANLNENLTDKQKDGDANTLVYTAKIKVNGGKIKKDISAEDIAFTGGFESCKTTDVITDKANGIITVTFTKARYLDSSAMNGTVVVKGSGQVIAYASTNRSYSSDLSCQLVDPVDHQKAESSTAWKQTYGFNSTTFGNKVTGNLLTKDIPLFIRTVFSDFAKTSGFPIVSSIFNLLGAVWDSTSLNSAKDVLTLDKIKASLHSEITKSSIFVNEKITENSIKTKLSNIGTQLTNYSNDYAGNLAKAQKSSDNLIKYTNMINNGQTAEEVGLQEADIDEMNAAFGNLYQSYATQTVLPTLGGKSTKDAYYAYAVSVNPTTSDKAYAKQVLDFCNLSNQILDGKIVSETNTGKTGDEALVATKTLKVGDENVFTAYKEYLSLKYNYNSQTFKEREAFNDNMYKCIKALNGSYYSAVAYDALILKMTNAGYQQTLDENQAIIDNPAGHTAEEIADATKGNEAIKKMITVVNNSLEEDNALLDSLEKQEKALEEAYAGAKKDLNDEKEAKFVTCYRNGHQYDFH